MDKRILVVDDEADIVRMLRDYFQMLGYQVGCAYGGREALDKLKSPWDLVLLDINMPDLDGLTLCRRVRDYISCPILFLTARVEEEDTVRGLLVGGDDYIAKPFSLDQLGARVSAHLRREERSRATNQVRFEADLSINYSAKTVDVEGATVPLAKKEYEIVEFLSMNAGQVFDKERIYERLWGWDGQGDSAVVAEHIRRIRAKLQAAGAQSHIQTVWGLGYKWVR